MASIRPVTATSTSCPATPASSSAMAHRPAPLHRRRPARGCHRRLGQRPLRLQRPRDRLRQRAAEQPRHHLVRVLPLAQPQRAERAAGADLPGRLRAGDQPVLQGPLAGGRGQGQHRQRLDLGPEPEPWREHPGLPHPQQHQLQPGRHQPALVLRRHAEVPTGHLQRRPDQDAGLGPGRSGHALLRR
ncbi:hypothetical protein G6F24_015697 [Rhizopus arrhizus]|nr:hypothetical protein G6F24_015697 [Rhizopus arrhizus]